MARLVRSAPLGVLSAEDDFRGPWPVVDPSASGYCVFGPAYLDDQGGRAAAVVPLPKSARSAVRKVCPEAAYLVQFDCGLVVALPAVAAALWCSSFYLVPTVSGWAVVCDPAAAAHVADGTHPSRPGVRGYYEFDEDEGWFWCMGAPGDSAVPSDIVDLDSAEDGVLCFICCDPARSPAAAAEWVLDAWCPDSLNGELSIPSWSDPAPALDRALPGQAADPAPLVVPPVPEEVVANALRYLESNSDPWRRPGWCYAPVGDVRQAIIEAWSAGYSAAAPVVAPAPPVVGAAPAGPAPEFKEGARVVVEPSVTHRAEGVVVVSMWDGISWQFGVHLERVLAGCPEALAEGDGLVWCAANKIRLAAPAVDPAGGDSVVASVMESAARLASVPGATAMLAAVCAQAGVVL